MDVHRLTHAIISSTFMPWRSSGCCCCSYRRSSHYVRRLQSFDRCRVIQRDSTLRRRC